MPIKNLCNTYAAPFVSGGSSLLNKYQYNGKELEADLGLLWNDYGARWYNPQLGIWNQIDPLAEKYAAWSGYNYVLGNPIRLLDKDGRKPDNYYRNQQGDLLAVVRTNEADRFYTVRDDNTVIRTPSDIDHQKADPWQRATDKEKGQIVTKIEKASVKNEGDQLNSEGMSQTQQNKVSSLTTTTNGAARSSGGAIATGAATTGGATIVGAIASSNTNRKDGIRIITTADPIDPSRANPNALTSAPIPQEPGSLPTPDVGQSAILPSCALPSNLTKPSYNDSGRKDGEIKLTNQNGLIPK